MQNFAKGVDWRLVPAAILILFALWILAALALACSTRWEVIPTLAICSAFFLLGLMSDYLFGRRAEPAWETFNTQKEVDVSQWNAEQKKLLSGIIREVRRQQEWLSGWAGAGEYRRDRPARP